jgi:hypothetical protein
MSSSHNTSPSFPTNSNAQPGLFWFCKSSRFYNNQVGGYVRNTYYTCFNESQKISWDSNCYPFRKKLV